MVVDHGILCIARLGHDACMHCLCRRFTGCHGIQPQSTRHADDVVCQRRDRPLALTDISGSGRRIRSLRRISQLHQSFLGCILRLRIRIRSRSFRKIIGDLLIGRSAQWEYRSGMLAHIVALPNRAEAMAAEQLSIAWPIAHETDTKSTICLCTARNGISIIDIVAPASSFSLQSLCLGLSSVGVVNFVDCILSSTQHILLYFQIITPWSSLSRLPPMASLLSCSDYTTLSASPKAITLFSGSSPWGQYPLSP